MNEYYSRIYYPNIAHACNYGVTCTNHFTEDFLAQPTRKFNTNKSICLIPNRITVSIVGVYKLLTTITEWVLFIMSNSPDRVCNDLARRNYVINCKEKYQRMMPCLKTNHRQRDSKLCPVLVTLLDAACDKRLCACANRNLG